MEYQCVHRLISNKYQFGFSACYRAQFRTFARSEESLRCRCRRCRRRCFSKRVSERELNAVKIKSWLVFQIWNKIFHNLSWLKCSRAPIQAPELLQNSYIAVKSDSEYLFLSCPDAHRLPQIYGQVKITCTYDLISMVPATHWLLFTIMIYTYKYTNNRIRLFVYKQKYSLNKRNGHQRENKIRQNYNETVEKMLCEMQKKVAISLTCGRKRRVLFSAIDRQSIQGGDFHLRYLATARVY